MFLTERSLVHRSASGSKVCRCGQPEVELRSLKEVSEPEMFMGYATRIQRCYTTNDTIVKALFTIKGRDVLINPAGAIVSVAMADAFAPEAQSPAIRVVQT